MQDGVGDIISVDVSEDKEWCQGPDTTHTHNLILNKLSRTLKGLQRQQKSKHLIDCN